LTKIITNSLVAVLIAGFPAGIALAIWLDDPTWLWMSLLAFIVIYAG
jgi:hypothetical protein